MPTAFSSAETSPPPRTTMPTQARSLQSRLLWGVLGGVVCVWLGTALMTWLDARHELNELLDAHLAQAAAVLVVQQVQAVGEDHEDTEGVDAPNLHRYASKVAFQVFHEGRLVMRSANAPSAHMETRRPPCARALPPWSWRAPHGAYLPPAAPKTMCRCA